MATRTCTQALALERWQDVCATALQRVFRAHKARVQARQRLRVVARDFQHAAALRLQTAMRARWARVAAFRVGMLHMETLRLREEAARLRRLQGALSLQAAVRRCLAREFVLVPERAKLRAACALRIGRVCRGHAGRRLALARIREVQVAASNAITMAYRVHLARVWMRRAIEHKRLAALLSEEQRRHWAAGRLQHAYLMHVSRAILRDRAARVALRYMRRAVARAGFVGAWVAEYCARPAAEALQAAVRRLAGRQGLAAEMAGVRLRASARRAFIRDKVCRKVAAEALSAAGLAALIRQSYASKLAADVIAGAAAASLARREFLLLWFATTYARPAATACLGAAVARAARQRQHRRWRACLRLQSVVRGHMDRGWVAAYTSDLVQHRQMLRHVVTIQAAQRGHVARGVCRRIVALMEEEESCVELQGAARRALAARAYEAHLLWLLQTQWATTLQRYWRGALGRHRRKQLAEHRVCSAAIVHVQRVARGHAARECARRRVRHVQEERCATRLQAWFRGIRGRAAAEERRRQLDRVWAATVIAAGGRGMAGRTRARAMRQARREQRLLLRLQAVVRGHGGRVVAEARRAEAVMEREWRTQMVIVVQCAVRQRRARAAHLAAIEQAEALSFYKEYCSDILQCSVRCFNARNRLRRRRMAAVVITALGRGWKARRKARHRRQVLDHQALYVPPHRLRPDLYAVPPGLDLRRPAKQPRQPSVRAFRAEAQPHLAAGAAGAVPWHVRQQQAVLDFQSKPQIKAFFSDLAQGRAAGSPARLGKGSAEASAAAPGAAGAALAGASAASRDQPVAVPRSLQSSFMSHGALDGSPDKTNKSLATPGSAFLSSPEKKPPRPVSAMPPPRPASSSLGQGPLPSTAPPPRPASALPAMAGRLNPPGSAKAKGVPPRFQKVRQGKQAQQGGDSDNASRSSSVRRRSVNQRPVARGSDSERHSSDDPQSAPPPPLQSIPSGFAATAAPEAALRAPSPPPRIEQAPPPPLAPVANAPPQRAVYNKDDISSDPASDEARRRKKDREKKRSKTPIPKSAGGAASPDPAVPPLAQSAPAGAGGGAGRPSTAGAHPADPAVEAAFNHCRLGKYREVEAALQQGVDVEARFGPDSNTMLLVCAQNGQKRIAKLLLRNFADMNAVNARGDSAMHLCFKFNYRELGEYLKSKGADDTIRNAKGQNCYEAKK